MAFAPADDPVVVALILVDEPKGAYYGGQVTGPVMKELLENVLPYLGVKPVYRVPDVRGMEMPKARKTLTAADLGFDITGDGNTVTDQFPIPGEWVNQKENVLLKVR
jgi:stage V sporulation protein D (sporulation-specific penicillin-binding protein)